MKSRRINRVICGVGIALLLLGIGLFARDLITSFHTESYTAENGTAGFTQGFHTSLQSIGASLGGLILIVLSLWLPSRSG